jgi:hypothetical protein
MSKPSRSSAQQSGRHDLATRIRRTTTQRHPRVLQLARLAWGVRYLSHSWRESSEKPLVGVVADATRYVIQVADYVEAIAENGPLSYSQPKEVAHTLFACTALLAKLERHVQDTSDWIPSALELDADLEQLTGFPGLSTPLQRRNFLQAQKSLAALLNAFEVSPRVLSNSRRLRYEGRQRTFLIKDYFPDILLMFGPDGIRAARREADQTEGDLPPKTSNEEILGLLEGRGVSSHLLELVKAELTSTPISKSKPFPTLDGKAIAAIAEHAKKRPWAKRREFGYEWRWNVFDFVRREYGKWIPGLTQAHLKFDRELYRFFTRQISLEGRPDNLDVPSENEAVLRRASSRAEIEDRRFWRNVEKLRSRQRRSPK